MFEGELRRVDADDDQSAPVVRAVPGLYVRQRAQAVDAGIRPEVDQDDLAAQLPERQRLAVDPLRDAGELRRRSEVPQRRVARGLARVAPQLSQLALRAVVLLDLLLQRVRVARERGLEMAIDVEGDRERRHSDDDAEHQADRVRM